MGLVHRHCGAHHCGGLVQHHLTDSNNALNARKLVAFYRQHNTDKISQVGRLLRQNITADDALGAVQFMAGLQDMYGAAPNLGCPKADNFYSNRMLKVFKTYGLPALQLLAAMKCDYYDVKDIGAVTWREIVEKAKSVDVDEFVAELLR